MRDWKKALISPTTSILQAIEVIDANSMGIVLVVDNDRHLLGTVTDGDIRRAILKGIQLTEVVSCIMNQAPVTVRENEPHAHILAVMQKKDLKQVPVIDEGGRIVNLEMLNDLIKVKYRENIVVIMAGGLGSRLLPLTQECPKPLLKVGDKPILETILENFIDSGFYRFYFAVNYKAEMIENYFGNGDKWGADIRYVFEKERMGTAGALSLLPEKPASPIIVMNGDLLTKINFQYLLDFHAEHNSQATMCVREYRFQIPYGVVQLEKHRLVSIIEKPVQNFFVSAGVYILNPEILELIPPQVYSDMPELFDKLVQLKYETAVFPVREYWLDIGRISDFERANGDFFEVFR